MQTKIRAEKIFNLISFDGERNWQICYILIIFVKETFIKNYEQKNLKMLSLESLVK